MITAIKSSVMVLILFITPYLTASLIGFNFDCETWNPLQCISFWIAFVIMIIINWNAMEKINKDGNYH